MISQSTTLWKQAFRITIIIIKNPATSVNSVMINYKLGPTLKIMLSKNCQTCISKYGIMKRILRRYAYLKLCDFGESHQYNDRTALQTICVDTKERMLTASKPNGWWVVGESASPSPHWTASFRRAFEKEKQRFCRRQVALFPKALGGWATGMRNSHEFNSHYSGRRVVSQIR